MRMDSWLNVLVVVVAIWRFSPLKQAFPSFSTQLPGEESDRSVTPLVNTTDSRAEAAVLGALLGDALALQTHYEYSYHRIRDFYNSSLKGTVDKLGSTLRANAEVLGLAITPGLIGSHFDMKNWHPGKQGGDLTDYGDCVAMALEFVAEGGWNLTAFDEHWWSWIQEYKGYINMATKAIVQARRGTGLKGLDLLSHLDRSEDFFAMCRIPALLFLDPGEEGPSQDDPQPSCAWSAQSQGMLDLVPTSIYPAFSRKTEAKQYCEHLGSNLCGGISCWNREGSADAPSLTCVLTQPGMAELREMGAAGRQVFSSSLLHCPASGEPQSLMRSAMESASVQYASSATFSSASYLAALAQVLLRGGASSRAEVSVAMREAVQRLPPSSRYLLRRVLDAVERKLREAEEGGEGWPEDPVGVDDLALRTFSLVGGAPAFEPYPCSRQECNYWQDLGKASPTVPALTAVLYLLLRYAGQPLEHLLAVNAILGGDNAARGVILGMLGGAMQGLVAIPPRLLSQLRVSPHVRHLLRQIRARRTASAPPRSDQE
mmetsp:Transcript_150701/g.484399  ORF Transcript_150701/g.484399 Transcript_150701/m.484399 type:complete len:543 (+) Transcript_150701:110-1738(+)